MITTFKLFEQAQKEEDWKLVLDISKIWNESIYSDPNKLLQFNDQYINFLNSQKDLITQNTSEEAWTKLQELLNKLTENKDKITESCSVYDDIYDWADSNLVQLKAEAELQNKDF
jgi:hypothetical protein